VDEEKEQVGHQTSTKGAEERILQQRHKYSTYGIVGGEDGSNSGTERKEPERVVQLAVWGLRTLYRRIQGSISEGRKQGQVYDPERKVSRLVFTEAGGIKDKTSTKWGRRAEISFWSVPCR